MDFKQSATNEAWDKKDVPDVRYPLARTSCTTGLLVRAIKCTQRSRSNGAQSFDLRLRALVQPNGYSTPTTDAFSFMKEV